MNDTRKLNSLETPTTMTTDERIQNTVSNAQLAFWATVADAFPEASTGDLDPPVAHALTKAMTAAITQWVALNVPDDDHGWIVAWRNSKTGFPQGSTEFDTDQKDEAHAYANNLRKQGATVRCFRGTLEI